MTITGIGPPDIYGNSPYQPRKQTTDQVMREILDLERNKLQREAEDAVRFPDNRKIKVIIEEDGHSSVVLPFDLLTFHDEPEKVEEVLQEVARQAVVAFAGVVRSEWALFDDSEGSAYKRWQQRGEVEQ